MSPTLLPRAGAESLRIALIGEPAWRLTAFGGVDRGGQSVHIEQVARGLAEAGHSVDVLTRRDDVGLPAVVELQPNARLLHVDAGPAHHVPQEALLQHMPAFAEAARRILGRSAPYDLMHTHGVLSGWVGLALRQHFSLPWVASFHALGLGRHAPSHEDGRFAPERIDIERALARHADRVIGACPEVEDGLRESAEFTWQQVAARLAAVYEEVAGDLALPLVHRAPRPVAWRAVTAGMLQ